MTTTLITGANKGLGRETARRLLADGHDVWLAARDEPRGRGVAQELRARFVRLDVTDEDSVAAAAAQVDAESDRLDVLINNAGITGGRIPPADTTGDDMRHVFDTNVFGIVRVVVASSIGVYGGLDDMRALREDARLPMTTGGNPVAAAKESRSRFIAAPTLVHAAVRGEPPTFGPPQRAPYANDAIDLCYVRDFGRALALLATAPSLRHRTYNVGSGRPTANGELAAVIREQLSDVDDAALLPGHDPGGPGHAVSLDIARLRVDTGYEPRFSVPEAVADYAAGLRAGHEL